MIAYSQELADPHTHYRLPLAGLPQLDTLDVQVLGPDPARSGETIELHRELASAVPRMDDLVLREAGGPVNIGLRSGDLALARLTLPGADAHPPDPPRAVIILFDTSASQAARFAAKIGQLVALIERLAAVHGAALPLRVWCFDQEVVEIFLGPAGQFDRTHAETIVRRRATSPASSRSKPSRTTSATPSLEMPLRTSSPSARAAPNCCTATASGYQDEDGCPDAIPMRIATYTGGVRGIYFDRGSARVTAERAPALDQAAAVLMEFPSIRVEITGYCAQGEQRPDHPTGHRLYALALARAGRHADAFAAILAGLQ